MAKYVYKKYNLVSEKKPQQVKSEDIPIGRSIPYRQGGTGYIIDNDRFVIYMSGNQIKQNEIMYFVTDKLDLPYDLKLSGTSNSQGKYLWVQTVSGSYYDTTLHLKIYEVATVFSKGYYIGEVIAEDGTYPSNGAFGGYWYVRDRLANQAPTISGSDQDQGGKVGPFSYEFTVDDADADQTLTVDIAINGSTIRTITNAERKKTYVAEVTSEHFEKLELNQTATLQIKVTDGNGAETYRRITFRRTNSAPKVTVKKKEFGKQNAPFAISYTVTDMEKDDVKVEIVYDGEILHTVEKSPLDSAQAYTPTKTQFMAIPNGKQDIIIRATDSKGMVAAEKITFEKAVYGCGYLYKEPTDVIADYIYVKADVDLAKGEKKKLTVSNNALDPNPKWEEAEYGEIHKFANKSATKPSIGIRAEVLPDPQTGDSYLKKIMFKYGKLGGK